MQRDAENAIYFDASTQDVNQSKRKIWKCSWLKIKRQLCAVINHHACEQAMIVEYQTVTKKGEIKRGG